MATNVPPGTIPPLPTPIVRPLILVPMPLTVVTKVKKPSKPTVNKPLQKIKRKRKVELALCPQCGSPNVLAASDIKHKLSDRNAIVTITFRCTSCKFVKETKTRNLSTIYEAEYKNAISQYYGTVKSPNEAELYFRYFKMEKNQYLKESDSADIYAFCQDDAGVWYRFAGESAKKILYFAVKDRKFKAIVAYQKHWKKSQHEIGYGAITLPQGTTLHFRQSPKIIGGVELI